MDDVFFLRVVINYCFGEEWFFVIFENVRMKLEFDDILGRINEEKRNFVSELVDLKF